MWQQQLRLLWGPTPNLPAGGRGREGRQQLAVLAWGQLHPLLGGALRPAVSLSL